MLTDVNTIYSDDVSFVALKKDGTKVTWGDTWCSQTAKLKAIPANGVSANL